MIKKTLLMSLACSLFFSTGCAARNRWFSRKDYSEIQDPFMESEAVASKDSVASREGSRETAGKAKLGAGSSSSSSIAKTESGAGTPPKSVLQTGAADDGVARMGRVANASYPEKTGPGASTGTQTGSATTPGVRSYQGPALSDFLSRKQAESVNAAAEKANTATRTATEVARDPVSAISPAARAAAIPDLNEEVAGFDNFLQKSSGTVNAKAKEVAAKVNATEQTAEDFSSWASQEKQKWAEEGKGAVSAASAAPTAAKQKVKSTAGELRKAADNAVMELSTPEFEEEAEARPLLKRYSSKSATVEEEPEFEFRQAPSKRSTASSNPFDNPFDEEEFESAPPAKHSSSQPTNSSSKSQQPLDSSFQMDSGWKPSHMTYE